MACLILLAAPVSLAKVVVVESRETRSAGSEKAIDQEFGAAETDRNSCSIPRRTGERSEADHSSRGDG